MPNSHFFFQCSRDRGLKFFSVLIVRGKPEVYCNSSGALSKQDKNKLKKEEREDGGALRINAEKGVESLRRPTDGGAEAGCLDYRLHPPRYHVLQVLPWAFAGGLHRTPSQNTPFWLIHTELITNLVSGKSCDDVICTVRCTSFRPI